MRSARNILPTLLAILAMISASAWSSASAACQIATTSSEDMAMAMPAHHQHHRIAAQPRQHQPSQSDPRLDCAACVGVLPPFPSMERQELMPLMRVAEGLQPLSGVHPAIDPPPPRMPGA